MFQNKKFIEQFDNIVSCLSVYSELIELVVERGRVIDQQIIILQKIEAKIGNTALNKQENNRVSEFKATGSD